MTKTLLAAAAALFVTVSAPAIAKDTAGEHSFTRDGQTYVYTKTTKTDRVVLSGHAYPSGSAFELTVRGDHISGVSGGVPVSFSVRNAQAKLTETALASR